MLVVRVVHQGRVLPGTEVAGLALGGVPEREIARRLEGVARADRTIRLSAGGRRLMVRPSDTGYAIDVPATADRALAAGREGPLAGTWSTLQGLVTTRRIAPVSAVDRPRLDRAVASLAARIDRPAFPGELVVDPQTLSVRARAPRTGRAVGRAELRWALLDALESRARSASVTVRRTPTAPASRVATVRAAAEAFLREPLSLRGAGTELPVPPEDLAAVLALESVPGGRDVRLGVDRSGVARLAARLANRRERKPRDARIQAPAQFASLDGKGNLNWRPRRALVSVRAGRAGRRVDTDALAGRLRAAVRSGRHLVSLPVRRVPPAIPTGAAQRVRSLIGTFTTRYEPGQARVTNIRRIARAVDGTAVAPGGRFSLNAVAGPRTSEKGYVKAPFIADGKIVPSVGGGVSQFSTTLYNAVYFAGLRVESHQPHSLYIDRYPAGREATLNFPDIDLAWVNDTDAPVLVRATSDATSVTVSLYGANGDRRVRAETGRRLPAPGGDFTTTVTRVVRYADGRTERQPFTTRYDKPADDG